MDLPTALFFLVIVMLITLMAVWEYVSPGSNPRVGILRFETTRGDRLFLSPLEKSSHKVLLGWARSDPAFAGSRPLDRLRRGVFRYV
jgi:predicted small integral membrane protein